MFQAIFFPEAAAVFPFDNSGQCHLEYGADLAGVSGRRFMEANINRVRYICAGSFGDCRGLCGGHWPVGLPEKGAWGEIGRN